MRTAKRLVGVFAGGFDPKPPPSEGEDARGRRRPEGRIPLSPVSHLNGLQRHAICKTPFLLGRSGTVSGLALTIAARMRGGGCRKANFLSPISHFWRDVRVVEGARLEGVCAHKAPGVRIPPPPLFPQSDRFCAIGSRPTPSGPEGSSGKWFANEPQVIYLLGFFIS